MKKFAALVGGIMFMCSSISFASVPTEKIALGKIVPGMTTAELVNICGQPNSKRGEDWIYNNFKVEVDDERPNIVEKVVTRSGALVTPDGVAVGQNAEVLNKAYGKADDVDVERDGTEYEYFSKDRTMKITFKVFNGVISKISCKVIY